MANFNDKFILGDEFFVYVNTGTEESAVWTPIAYTTTCTLNISGDTIDCGNHFSGYWQQALAGKLSWNISSENLYSLNNGTDESATGFEYFFDAMSAHKEFKVRFGFSAGAENAEMLDDSDESFALDTTKSYYEGKAFISSLSLNADTNTVASMTAEFTGNGKLTKKKD